VVCADTTYLLFDMHHIVTDGYSKKLLFDNINALYAGQYPALPGLAYIDYACWVDQQKCLPGRAVSLEYWKAKLFPLPTPLDLPTDHARPAVRSTKAECVRASLGAADVARLRNVARSAGATLYEALIASYSVAIACITNADDLILGSPSLGRNVSGTFETVGMFASTACYRIKANINDTFIGHLQKVADEVRVTTQQEFFPLDDLVKIAAQASPAPMARHPIFDIMLAFHAYQLVNVELDGHPVIWEPSATRSAIFDLHMHIFERPEELDIQLVFNSSIFSGQTASDLLAAYLEVVKKLTSRPEQSMESIL
jgi:surfactin family lipopeptide synthetase A